MEMTPTEALQIMALPKEEYGWTGFKPRSNHKGSVHGIAQLRDTSGTFYPGLTIEIEVKSSIVVARCFYLFTLLKKQNSGDRVRVYQLDVQPSDKVSHTGQVTILGPHEHFGDEAEPSAIVTPGVNCSDWEACFRWFKRQITLQMPNVASP